MTFLFRHVWCNNNNNNDNNMTRLLRRVQITVRLLRQVRHIVLCVSCDSLNDAYEYLVCEWLNIYSVTIALYLWLIVESMRWFTHWQCRSVVRPLVCHLWSVYYFLIVFTLHTCSSGGIKLSWKLLLSRKKFSVYSATEWGNY